MKSAKYVQVQITGGADTGELLGLLQEDGALGASEEMGVASLYWLEECWDSGARARLMDALLMLGFDPESVEIVITPLEEQDWNLRWADSVKPIRIGRNILIGQSWNRSPVEPGLIELIIDPKRAFGTGYHATTQLLAEWLEDLIVGGENILDVGTGSGILAMIALRLGGARALGIDSDPVAIECAVENAAVNGFGPELTLRTCPFSDLESEKFDCILANLDRSTLLRCAAMIPKNLKAGGRLLISGILREDGDDIAGLFASAGGIVYGSKSHEEWLALEIQFPS